MKSGGMIMFEEILCKTAKFTIKRSKLVVSIVPLFIFLSAISASNLKFAPMKYENCLPLGDEVLIQYELYKRNFKVSENDVFIFVKGTLNFQVYEYMLKLEENLNQIDGVRDVISPASMPKREDLIISPSWAVMIVCLSKQEEEITNQIERVLEFTPKPVGVNVEVTGNPVLDVQIVRSVQKSLRLTANLAIIIMIVILFTVFSDVVRRKRLALMPFVISIMSVTVVVGLMPNLGIKMNSHLSSMIPILIGLTIDYAAHVQSRFEEERLDKGKNDAIVASVTKTGLAVLISMITTVIGFMSMTATKIPTLT